MSVRIKTVWNFFANHAILYYRSFQSLYRNLYPEQHQLTSTTSTDRYPELFAETKRYAGEFFGNRNLSILSFGCSTGEECASLKKYFPVSKIIGADINKSNLRKAERRNSATGIKYILSTPENIAKEGPYDLIFCLSVLCRWEDTKYVDNCAGIYPIEKFEATVESLSNQLSKGGMIVIFNSNFRFEDTRFFLKNGFEILPTPSVPNSGFVYKFDAQHNRLEEEHKHCVYRKKSE